MSDVLSEAQAILKDRQAQYGDPKDHWAAVASCWTEWLRLRGLLSEGARLDASDAATLMVFVKALRLANGYHKDSLIDICGYAVVADRCA